MRIVVLGAAAGGGFPQWNSASAAALRSRHGDPAVPPASQCSLAVSADETRWVVLDASPDLRMQIEQNSVLHPRLAPRSSPIAAVVLTGADVDHIAGLLTLREGHAFALYASERVHAVLAANPIFQVLSPELVPRRTMALDEAVALRDAAGESLGLSVRMFAVPGKVALYLEDPNDASGRRGTVDGDVVGLQVSEGLRSFFYIPGCAAMTADLGDRVRGAELVFFDATLWRDDEMISTGAGPKTGRRMGHMSVDGADGAIAAFAELGVRRKVCIHLNNTNPLLLADSAERTAAIAAGWTVAHDGMELTL